MILPFAATADSNPIPLILHYANTTGDVEGARSLADFYARNLPTDANLYKALNSRLKDGTWQKLDETARSNTALFGFTPPNEATVDVIESFARTIVIGITPANLKARTELAIEYEKILPRSEIFPWIAAQLIEIRKQENRRQSLLKSGQMIVDDAQKQLAKAGSNSVPENRYQKLKQARNTTSASLERAQEEQSRLQQERNRGLALINESYDYPEAAKQLPVFVKELAQKLREGQR